MAQSLSAAEGSTAKPDKPGRKPKDQTAGVGHNSKPPMTAEEKGALLSHHIGELRKLEAQVEVVRAPFKAAQENVTKQFNLAKSELGKNYTRKYLQDLMQDVGAKVRNLASVEQQRFQDRVALGLPVFGKQMDLFGDAKTDTEKDAIAAEADGYLAGRRGDEAKPPVDVGPLTADWMRGYHKGQDETVRMVAQAMELRAKTSKPAEAPKPDADPEADIEASARRLKASGFGKRTPPANQVPAE